MRRVGFGGSRSWESGLILVTGAGWLGSEDTLADIPSS